MEIYSPLKANRYRMAVRLALILTLFAAAWLRASATESAPVTVPITLHGVHIFVEATIDDKPVTLVLDTGAGANVLTPRAAARLQLTPEKGRTPVAGAGGNTAPVSQVKIGALGVGATRLTDQSAYLIPLPDALPCDGLLGTPFLSEWIVTIDYAQSRLTLSPRRGFMPPAHASPFSLRLQKGTPHMQATVDGTPGWFQIDTGAGNAITLYGPFVERNHLRGKYLPSLTMATGRGVGGLIYGDVVRLPECILGPFRLTQPVAELSRQTQGVFSDREVAGNLGGEIWQRFTVTLDYGGRKIYLAPNSQYDRPFIGNRSGLGIDDNKGKYTVLNVIANGPGAEAGVKTGDTVLAINDTPMEQLKPWELHDILKRSPGTKVQLLLRSPDETVREVTLTLRDLV
jgi:hypothetical protein